MLDEDIGIRGKGIKKGDKNSKLLSKSDDSDSIKIKGNCVFFCFICLEVRYIESL